MTCVSCCSRLSLVCKLVTTTIFIVLFTNIVLGAITSPLISYLGLASGGAGEGSSGDPSTPRENVCVALFVL
jgi:hypothetical protein